MVASFVLDFFNSGIQNQWGDLGNPGKCASANTCIPEITLYICCRHGKTARFEVLLIALWNLACWFQFNFGAFGSGAVWRIQELPLYVLVSVLVATD